jgi:integrase
MMNKLTANEYRARLDAFKGFAEAKYSLCVDVIIAKIKKEGDPYSLLTEYARYQGERNISASTLKQRVVTVKNFLEYHDIDISPRRFKLKVKLPKTIRKNKEALSKEDIIEILNATSDIRIKTYVMLLASTGMRAGEAFINTY